MAEKNYARTISQELNIDYNDLLKMTLADIQKIYFDNFQEEIKENMKDKKSLKIISYLLEDYDKLYEIFGKSLIRAICNKNPEYYITTRREIRKFPFYEDEKKEELLRGEIYSTYREEAYYKGLEYTDKILLNAIYDKYPIFKKYNISQTSSNFNGLKSNIKFQIPVKNDENDENDEGKYDFFNFYCSIGSFLKKDVECMIDDFLYIDGYYSITNKESSSYIKTNKFISSNEFLIFLKEIEENV